MTKQEPSTASLSLLIVEDHLPSLELMTEVFLSLQAEVRPISDGQEAVHLVGKQKFDGIFLDLEMPNMHGLELTRAIRRSSWNKSTPIVIVTGRDDRHTMQQAFSTGATFFLLKPVDRHKLTNLFRTVRGALIANRRRHVRVPLQTDVTCTLGLRTVHGRSWNLSQGGIQVEAENLTPGGSMRIRFSLPGSPVAVDAFGVVAWVRESRQGIQFTKMGSQNEEDIRAFIASLDNYAEPAK
jgi:CheY-like chemotaxis protein